MVKERNSRLCTQAVRRSKTFMVGMNRDLLQLSHFSGEMETKLGEGTCEIVYGELVDI